MSSLPVFPSDLTGYKVIPDLTLLRADYQATLGQQRGNYAADALPVSGWYVAFDMRSDGIQDVVCERRKPDGSVASVVWPLSRIRSAHPPRAAR